MLIQSLNANVEPSKILAVGILFTVTTVEVLVAEQPLVFTIVTLKFPEREVIYSLLVAPAIITLLLYH